MDLARLITLGARGVLVMLAPHRLRRLVAQVIDHLTLLSLGLLLYCILVIWVGPVKAIKGYLLERDGRLRLLRLMCRVWLRRRGNARKRLLKTTDFEFKPRMRKEGGGLNGKNKKSALRSRKKRGGKRKLNVCVKKRRSDLNSKGENGKNKNAGGKKTKRLD
jgi:hypothetical protein